MKLLTHNLLVCNRKSCTAPGVVNFPLKLKVNSWIDYDDDSAIACTAPLMKRLSEKLEWSALRQTLETVSQSHFLTLFSSIGVSAYQRLSMKLCLRTKSSCMSSTWYWWSA